VINFTSRPIYLRVKRIRLIFWSR
jgi:hypothetical protein